LLPARADSDNSWTVLRAEIERSNFDLKAINPNRKHQSDDRTSAEILARIENLGRDADKALADLKTLIG
jgi:hypothetical protein